MFQLYMRSVKIKSGMTEFIGCTGQIVGQEMKMYRVRLDEPVMIPGVGMVKDDLWERACFNVLRD